MGVRSYVRGSGGWVSDIHLTTICKAPASWPGCSENTAGGYAHAMQGRVKGDPGAGRLTPGLFALRCWKNEAATNHPGKRGEGRGGGCRKTGSSDVGQAPS